MTAQMRPLAAVVAVGAVVITLLTMALLQLAPSAAAQVAATAGGAAKPAATAEWAMMAAAIAVGISSLAAGYAVASVGSAAVGALAEKPELLGRVLILVGLAEGIAIYGLIVAILILNRIS